MKKIFSIININETKSNIFCKKNYQKLLKYTADASMGENNKWICKKKEMKRITNQMLRIMGGVKIRQLIHELPMYLFMSFTVERTS